MSIGFVLPTLFGVLLVVLMGHVQWNLTPRVAVPLLTAAMTVSAFAVALIVASTAAAFVLGPARTSMVTDWCRTIPLHHEVEPAVGVLALILSAILTVRCGRTIRARIRAVKSVESRGRVSVVESEEPFAFAVPTSDGCVVVSRGLLTPLTASERRAVFAHERAHLRLGHHRYLLATELSRMALPFATPLVAQILHATERAADEAAVIAVQDRSIVARAIATSALTTSQYNPTLPGIGGGSVTRRVEALLWPHREPPATLLAATTAGIGGAAVAVALAVQLHHFGTLLSHLCHGTF